MHVLISGASGLVGNAVRYALVPRGHTWTALVRGDIRDRDREVQWDIPGGKLDVNHVTGANAIVHLAGENVAGGRWNAARKRRIMDSRVQSTQLLAKTIGEMKLKPKVFVCASAIGIYGDQRGGDLNAVLDEESNPGTGFLADVCRAWEASCEPIREMGVRVVNLRFGVILSPKGGALAKMLLPFKIGAGGNLGNGRQVMSWVSLPDAANAVIFALENDSLEGPVNVVAPKPVTNAEYTKTLGTVLERPTIAPMPAIAAKLAFGQMADEMLLASQNVAPAKLKSAGFSFQHGDVEKALRAVLDKPKKR